MSKADYIYLKTTNRILKEGVWDTNEVVRPKWADGTSAHTAKVFAVNNVYDLSEEFPIVTLRFTNWKAAIDEILWIWQKKSNNVKELNSHIWDQWADKNGSIGKAYGYQLGRKAKYKDGTFDQVDRVIWYLKNQPAFRSMVTELFVHEDLHAMGLYPCVHGAQFDVTDGKLNLFLNQRSNDTLAAGSWNVVQYSALVYMLAKVCNLKPGKLSHMIVNSHIYDRHLPFIVDITLSRVKLIEERLTATSLKTARGLLTKADFEAFKEFKKNLAVPDKNLDRLLKESKALEINIGRFDLGKDDKNYLDSKKENFDYEKYCQKVTRTSAFKRAEFVVEVMLNHPEFEKALSFETPVLLLDEKVDDFYKFLTPKMKDNSGKIVDNPSSSFAVKNYNYQTDGVKLQAKVPVAE